MRYRWELGMGYGWTASGNGTMIHDFPTPKQAVTAFVRHASYDLPYRLVRQRLSHKEVILRVFRRYGRYNDTFEVTPA